MQVQLVDVKENDALDQSEKPSPSSGAAANGYGCLVVGILFSSPHFSHFGFMALVPAMDIDLILFCACGYLPITFLFACICWHGLLQSLIFC